jgi:hypothetical protein
MKKIIIFTIAGLMLAVAGWFAYGILTTKTHSPAAKAIYAKDDVKISIDYCQPHKKGRLIFGTEVQKALVPFGKYWRTGANEATEIQFNKDLKFGDHSIKSGRYRFYTIPGEKEWIIALNSELGKWGYNQADYSKDILRINVPSENSNKFSEQFTISIQENGPSNLMITLKWDYTQVNIPVSY